MVSVAWATQPLVTFRQSLIMWLLLAHGKQRPPSIRHWHSWGVSLPSLLSLSIKSGFFCACSLGFRPRCIVGWLWFVGLIPEFPVSSGSRAPLTDKFGLALPIPLVNPEYQVS